MKCCKECPNDKCILCNGNDIKYPELTLEEALNKIMKDDSIYKSNIENIYYSNITAGLKPNILDNESNIIKVSNLKKYYAFNSYKREMIELEGLYNINFNNINNLVILTQENLKIITSQEYNNEYFQAIVQGYDFTCSDHIYQKNGNNYFKYNAKTLIFEKI